MAEHSAYPARLVVIDQDFDAGTPNGGLVAGIPLNIWHHRGFSFQTTWTAHSSSGLLTLDADIQLAFTDEFPDEPRGKLLQASFVPYTDDQFLRYFTTAGTADGVDNGRPKNPGPGKSYYEYRDSMAGAFRVSVQRNSGSGHVKVIAVAKE